MSFKFSQLVQKRAFALVELLVVISIAVVLGVMGVNIAYWNRDRLAEITQEVAQNEQSDQAVPIAKNKSGVIVDKTSVETVKSVEPTKTTTLVKESSPVEPVIKESSDKEIVPKKEIVTPLPVKEVSILPPPVKTNTNEIDHLTDPDSGWTDFTLSSDTRIIYVSSSGNDTNNGLSPETPKKTIKSAIALMRANTPDWVLLKRGDTFDDPLITEQTSTFWKIPVSGRSASEKALVASYGEGERPIVKDGFQSNITVGNIALVGLKFDGVSINFLGTVTDLLVEDNYFSRGHVNFQGTSGRHSDIEFRRNVVVDSYSTGSHSQGLFSNNVDELLIEENVFDHNGWLTRGGGAGSGAATQFNHNVYINSGVTELTFRKNISARASSHGVQARPGGVVEDNLFVANPISILFGGGDVQVPGGVSGEVTNNVVLNGSDIDSANLRGWGIYVTNVNSSGVDVANNLVANEASLNKGAFGIEHTATNAVAGALSGTYDNNVIYNWGRGLKVTGTTGTDLKDISITGNKIVADTVDLTVSPPMAAVSMPTFDASVFSFANNQYFYNGGNPANLFWVGSSVASFDEWLALTSEAGASNSAPAFPNPSRTIESYNASIGGSASLTSFLNEARKQSKSNWRDEYTAQEVNDYMREGFGL